MHSIPPDGKCLPQARYAYRPESAGSNTGRSDPQGDQSHWFQGEWWYNSTITFLFGLLFARFHQPLTRLLNRFRRLLLPVSFFLAAVCLQRSIVCVRRGGYYEDTLRRSSLAPPGLFTSLAGRTLLWQSAVRQGVNADRLSHYDVWFDRQYCYSWWWLKQEEGQLRLTAPIVGMDGTLRPDDKPVNKPGGAIRPVVWVCIPE